MIDRFGIELKNLCTMYTMKENNIFRLGAQVTVEPQLRELVNAKPNLKLLLPPYGLLDDFQDPFGKNCLTIDTFTSASSNLFRINGQHVALEDKNLGIFEKLAKFTKDIKLASQNNKDQEACLNNFDFVGSIDFGAKFPISQNNEAQEVCLNNFDLVGTIGFGEKFPISQNIGDIQIAANNIHTAIITTIENFVGILRK